MHALINFRFIHQIRYGCTYKACSTTTCFSCRKKLADGAPVRRYNATSARALAFHLISLDNPEQGLCPHPAAPRPSEVNKLLKSRVPMVDDSRSPYNRETKSITSRSNSELEIPKNCSRFSSGDKRQGREMVTDLSMLEEPSTTDRRSFVQNMFETVAIKMVEWLTPRNLESLAVLNLRPENKSDDNVSCDQDLDSIENCSAPIKAEIPWGQSDESSENKGLATLQPYKPTTQPKNRPAAENISNSNALPRHFSPSIRRLTNSSGSSGFRGIINKVPREEPIHDRIVSPHRLSSNIIKRKPLKQTLVPSSEFSVANFGELPSSPCSPFKAPEILIKKKVTNLEQGPILDGNLEDTTSATNMRDEKLNPRRSNTKLPPQSLPAMTAEVIELFCNILQVDGTCEKHLLHPSWIGEKSNRKRNNSHKHRALDRDPLHQEGQNYPNSLRLQWKAFIEQCFYDVLRNPRSLLTSFRDDSKKLLDSHSIWYLMLRMTRVSPSIVLDSLWNAVETLFNPPIELDMAYDWDKGIPSYRSRFRNAISNRNAADILCICLHALIAVIPLVQDVRQLTNMSRIRSYGLSMLARDLNSSESVALCLQYEDAFKNDLAIRLARRIFMAIPTRRRFSESLLLQNKHNNENREPDILDTIISALESLNSKSRCFLEFSSSEKELHEKKAPIAILDWARTIMLQDWQGDAEVLSDGPFGGALATIAEIHKNREILLLNDIHFHTEYFAERLDSINMPIEWLSFSPNKKTVHLLDYPYLFNPATLISYFRAINYSKMNLAHEAAKSESARINSIMHDHCLIIGEHTRERLQERLRTATSKFMVMEIRRSHVLLDTFNSIWRREERELMRPLKIRLGEEDGEEGSDSGGVQQEYLRLAIAEALNPNYGTFTIDSRTRMTWFQPGSPEPLWKYELIGIIMSLAVYNGLTLPVTFPKALYRKLLGDEVTELDHIADGWPELANGLTSLLEWDEKNGSVEEVFTRTYEFSVEQFGLPVSLEMKQSDSSPTWPQFSLCSESAAMKPTDAPLVTSANRKKYVSDYIRYLTDISIRPQFTAFKNGFFTCISHRSVSLFDPPTFQSLIEGVQVIDINELRHITRYIGWDRDVNHHTVKDFWSVVKNYDLDMRRKLLEFVTASDRVPVGGTRSLQFTIQKNGIEDKLLPTSYTCYGILLLPEYSSRDILEKRLAMALENSKGFGFA